MPTEIADLANEYDETFLAGQTWLHTYWKHLQQLSRDWLIKSRYFEARGQVVPREQVWELGCESVADEFIYAVGELARCQQVELPSRAEVNAFVPGIVFGDQVLHSAGNLLLIPAGRDPIILRLALRAIRKHELANLLMRLPGNAGSIFSKPAFGCLMAAIAVIATLGSPAILGFVLVAAVSKDVGTTVAGLYLLGLIALFVGAVISKNKSGSESKDEVAYAAWNRLDYSFDGPWAIAGAGAAVYFEEMRRDGVAVPLVAFDLCAMLQQHVLTHSTSTHPSE